MPLGKVEFASSVLEGLGVDTLPGWSDDSAPGPDWSPMLFTGVREDPCVQTGQRHVPELRARAPEAVCSGTRQSCDHARSR